MGSWKSLEGRGSAGQIRQEGEDGGRVIDFTKPERHQMFQIVQALIRLSADQS
jgi:hypothetical protein